MGALVTVWIAFQVFDDKEPSYDDVIAVAQTHKTLFELLRERAERHNQYITTSPNPLFSHEFRYRNTDRHHSYIGIKELPVFGDTENAETSIQAG